MNIIEIENLSTVKNNKWNLNKEYISNNSYYYIMRSLSVFSVLFSTSVIFELFNLNLPMYEVIIFSLFILAIIISNEYIKLNKFVGIFSFKNNIENKIIGGITLFLSLFISLYGVYTFLNKKDDVNINLKNNNIKEITLIENDFNNKIDSINKININELSQYNDRLLVYTKQLEQYNNDKLQYKNKNLTFYNDVNVNITEINKKIIDIHNDFKDNKINQINEINKIKTNKINNLKNISNTELNVKNTKNNIILIMFLLCTVLVDAGIIYLCFLIGKNKVYNKSLDDEKELLYNEKIKHIKSTTEYTNFIMYKDLINRIYNTRIKSDQITYNDIAILLKNHKLSKNEITNIIDELRGIGIISQSVKRVGSKLQLNHDDALIALRKNYEYYFVNY